MRERRSDLITVAVNSTLGFALGTVLALQVYQLGLVLMGLLYDRQPEWYADRVVFAAAGPDVARSGGVLMVLLLGWALASIYRGGTRYDGTRLTVLWVMLHFFRQGSLELLRGPFDRGSDAALALASSNLSESLTWVVAALGAAGLLGIGLLAAPALLRFALENLSTKQARIGFIFVVGIVAWLVGALPALVLVLPGSDSPALALLPWSGVFLIFTLLASPEPRHIHSVREPAQPAWGTLVLLVVLIAAAKYFLADGVAITL